MDIPYKKMAAKSDKERAAIVASYLSDSGDKLSPLHPLVLASWNGFDLVEVIGFHDWEEVTVRVKLGKKEEIKFPRREYSAKKVKEAALQLLRRYENQ